MLVTFFILAFIALPLAIAVAVMLYRSRWFILGVAAVATAMAVIWGFLILAASVDRWLDRSADAAAIVPCTEAMPGLQSCTPNGENGVYSVHYDTDPIEQQQQPASI
jgi:hypothetical protein